MGKYIFISLLSILLLSSAYSQYCMDGGPSSTIDSNVDTVLLVGETNSIDFIGCPGVVGVQDLTTLPTNWADLSVDSTYSLYVHFGTCGNNYTGVGQVWIDFDQSESFDLFETIGTWVGIPPVPIDTFIFTVPAYAVAGETRMRIVHYEGGSLNINPCDSFVWGSVMDFKITIPNGLNCSGYIGDKITDPIDVPAIPYSDNNSNSICYTNQMTLYDSPDIYYRVAIQDTTIDSLKISLCESNFDTYLSIVNKNDSVVFYNDDNANCSPHSEIIFPVQGLDTLYAVVQGWNLDTGNFTIDISVHSYISSFVNEIEKGYLIIYPNPATESLTLTLSKGEGTITQINSVEIIDMHGKTVFKKNKYSGKIDLSELNSGIYILAIYNKEKVYHKKLIIQ